MKSHEFITERKIINESIEEIEDQWSSMGIEHSLYERNGTIYLSQIVVPKSDRKQGTGTKAMKALVNYADQTGQKIALSPSSDFGGSKTKLVKFYKRFGFVPNKGRNKDFTTMETMIRYPKTGINEYNVDNQNGLGKVPINAEVDYFGLRVLMKPSVFLKLAAPLEFPVSVDHIVDHMKKGGALASPYLYIDVPEEWNNNDFEKPAIVTNHEGRNRMLAIRRVEGDDPVEVHLFPRYKRNRHITDEWIKSWNNGLWNEGERSFISGPIFKKM